MDSEIKRESLYDVEPEFEVKIERQTFQKGLEVMDNINATEIKPEKLDQTFVVKKETSENKEEDDELKYGLEVLETLMSKIKEEPFVDIKPKFEVKNDSQELHNRLEILNTVDGAEINPDKVDQKFVVKKEDDKL